MEVPCANAGRPTRRIIVGSEVTASMIPIEQPLDTAALRRMKQPLGKRRFLGLGSFRRIGSDDLRLDQVFVQQLAHQHCRWHRDQSAHHAGQRRAK